MLTLSNSRHFFQMLFFGGILICNVATAQEQPPEFKGVGVNFGPSNNSFGLLTANPSNFEVNMESVNLYTGQHVETFPLESITGRGGLGVSLALEYNGNVYGQVREENRKSQASPFGLGFSLAMPSIIVHHNGTADIFDDEYKLIVNNTGYDLKPIESNDTSYITNDGQPWKIYRRIDTVSNRETIIGWTILIEDGTVYEFGDFADTLGGWNATRNILRYGNFVGIGVALGDTAYPSQWDLKRIEDVEGLNWIDISYLQDSAYLLVKNASGDALVDSDFPYTRASYIDEIVISDGKKIKFEYGVRQDVQPFHNINSYEFYLNMKINEIKTLSKDDIVLSRVIFNHAYYQPQAYYHGFQSQVVDSSIQKLLLRSIHRYSSDESEKIPGIEFDYYTDDKDPRYLRVSHISYPTGAIKEIRYDVLANSINFSLLDHQIIDNVQFDLGDTVIHKENIFVALNAVGADEDSVIIGVWDGYWHVDTIIVDLTSSGGRDLIGLSSDRMVVIPSGDTIFVFNWEGGFWKIDTILNAVTRTNSVYLHVGSNDCFIATTGPYSNYCEKGRGIKSAYYFRRINGIWLRETIVEHSGPGWESHTVQISKNTYMISELTNDCGVPRKWEQQFRFGVWNSKNYAIAFGNSGVRYINIPEVPFQSVIGADYVSFRDNNEIHLWKWDGITWDSLAYNFSPKTVQGIYPLSNGLCYSVDHQDISLTLGRVSRTSGGFRNDYSLFADSSYGKIKINRLWGSETGIIGQYEPFGNTAFYKWTGLDFDPLYNIERDTLYKKSAIMHRDFWAYGVTSNDTVSPENYKLQANIYEGNQNWPDPPRLNINFAEKGIVASDWYVLWRHADTSFFTFLKPYYFNNFFRVRHLDTIAHTGDLNFSNFSASRSSFLAHYEHDSSGSDLNDAFAYKIYDTLFNDKPPIVAVDSVIFYNFSGDSNPIIQTYEYFGALLDEQANTPRFAEAKVSSPYYSDDLSPFGYTVNLFYNDIDSTGFYDPAVYSGGRVYPDLKNSTTFGIPNGGYLLDGIPYLTYTYTAGETGRFDDSSRSFYSLVPNDTVADVIKVLLDSTFLYRDSILTKTFYKYEPRNWRIVEKKTPHKVANTFIIDSVFYAYVDTTGMEEDNAVVQVSKTKRIYDNDGIEVILSIDSTDYALKGSWVPVRSYAFPDFDSLGNYLIVSDTLIDGRSFDSLGNMIARKNHAGVVSGTHLSPDGTYPIATFSNANPEEVIIFDAEYGLANSKWENLDSTLVSISNSNPFTGDYALKFDKPGVGHFYDALKLHIVGDSLKSDKYYFSMWTKSLDAITPIITAYDNTGACLQLSTAYFATGKWMQVNRLIDLTGCGVVDSLTIVLRPNFISGDSSFVDDIRFHPVDASISTATFDTTSGLKVSQSDRDNFPLKFEYDKLQRLVNTYRYTDTLLERTEYEFAKKPSLYYPFGKYAASDPFHTQYKGLKTTSIVLSKSQTVNYHLEVKECYGYGVSYAVIKNEDTTIYSLTDEEAACSVIVIDNYFFALAGDEVRIEVYSDTGISGDTVPAYASAYIGYAVPVDAPYDPDKPNYVKTTRFVEGTDPLESVMFFDGMGKNLQSRSDAPNSGKTVVSGWLTDVFGQQIKTYKSYIEEHSVGYDTTYRYDSVWQYCDWGEFYTFDEHDTSLAIIDSTEFTMDGPARIYYTFHMLQEIGVGEGCYLFLNDTLVDSLVDCRYCGGLRVDDTCLYVEKWKDGVINVDSGDVIKYLLNNSYKGFPPICTTSYDGTWCGVYWDIGCVNGVDTSMFVDTIVANSVVHYDNDSLVNANADSYYNSSGPGPDCEGYPYLQNVFESNIRRRRIEAALPGKIYSVDDTNTAAFIYGTDMSNKVYVDTTYDQDDIMTVKSIDHWGLFSKTASYYEQGLGTESVIQITNNDYKGRATSAEIDTGGAQPIKLRESFYNDLNQQDSTWKMDYGTIRMIYDISGNLRFMQNDKRKDEDRFIYFKYDETGRKIEEGREDSAATYFKQSWADSADFPSTSHVPVVRYKWFYDSYDTILAPGKLVRVENGDQSYYSEFHYFPEGDSDLTIVKLPITGDNLKGIKHEYNWDGSLKYLTVFPHWDSATANNERKSEYLYNEAGKIRAIKSLDSLPGSTDSLFYVQYKYTAEGAIETAAYGISYDSTIVDTIQKIDYTYNSIGALIGVNHPDSVVYGLDYGVTAGDDNDHFGMNLTYLEPDGQYANGRVSKMSSARSSTDSVRNFSYDYTYNDLGWLEIADETSDTSVYTRKYGYNALGNRLYVMIGSDSVHYVYDTVSGSSRLIRTSDMPTADSFFYDVLGNLIADTAHERYRFTYGYRNLIWSATLKKEIGQLNPHSKLGFMYDENENRILKDYNYYVLVECGPPPPGPMGFGPGGGLCPEARHTYTTYLYDNGVPLAVFDNSDNVIDMFINGPNGKIATFWQNDIDKLHYYFSDQVGSTRMTMIGKPSVDTANVSSWYTYNPFGSLMESYEVYSTPYRFTSKLYDDDLSFDLYYFGARYYDPVLGKFTTIDKAGQFASGFTYGNNDPILGVDPDGNLFFLATPFLIGALISSGSYAITTDVFRLEEFLGYAFVGGISSSAGAAIAKKSAIFGLMTSSTLSSTGTSIIEGRDGFMVNFGFATMTNNGFSFNNPLSFSGAASWLAVAEDLNKVLPGGETLEEMQHRQIANGEVPKGTWNVTSADIDAIGVGSDREVWQIYEGRKVHLDGTVATAKEIRKVRKATDFMELRLQGGYHLYSRVSEINEPSKYIVHKDALGSWSKLLSRTNWGTGLQHILFESGPHDYLFFPILNDIPYFYYRNPYSARKY